MIFPKDIDNDIIQIIVRNKTMTFQELELALWDTVSSPNLYKKIQEFVKKHILVKDKKQISLNKKWIISYLNLAKNIQENFLGTEEVSISLEVWEHAKYSASSLYELDSIWASLLAELNLKYNWQEVNYIYNSHTYHIIGMPEADTVLFENIWSRVSETLFLVWNKTPIDLYWCNLMWEIINTRALTDKDSWLLSTWYCLNVVWEYYLEVLFPDILNQYFELLFENTQDIKELNIDVFKQLFHIKVPISVTLYRDRKQAKALSKEIETCFKKHERSKK